ncbi:MAG TPA: type IV secretion system protein [Steroidobacter sp.]|nr:type IV secretion system protein [Steroidobacter sp.]
MGFFGEFGNWLNGILLVYIATNTARVAALIEPAVATLAVLYTIVWGYLQLTGKIEEPFLAGIKRIVVLVIVIGGAVRLWMYNELIVDTFFIAPANLAGMIVGAFDQVGVVDAILASGADAASLLIQRGGLLDGNIAFYLAGFLVHVVIGATVVYTAFLLTLSRIALSVLLAIGPLFIALLLFDSTRRFFEAWIAQLANYALIAILTVMVAALMLHVVSETAADVIGRGGDILIADGIRLCVAAGLTFLVMRQVMPMAAGLASGLALSTFGAVSAAVGWGLGTAKRTTGQLLKGLADRETSRWDSLSRKLGYYTRRGIVGGAQALGRRWRENGSRAR